MLFYIKEDFSIIKFNFFIYKKKWWYFFCYSYNIVSSFETEVYGVMNTFYLWSLIIGRKTDVKLEEEKKIWKIIMKSVRDIYSKLVIIKDNREISTN